MATFTAIPEKTQTATAMKRVIDCVMQDKKTVLDGIKLVSGQNCVPASAFEVFMDTKHQYGKANGVLFNQYVQSFKPGCGTTPEQIHQIGLELNTAPGCDEPTSRCQTSPSMWTLGGDQPVIPRVTFIR